MNPTQILLYVVIAALVVWRVIVRQLLGSAVTLQGLALIPAILLVLGIVDCAKALPGASGTEIALLAADLAILLVLGLARAATVRLSLRDGNAYQKGSALTLVLWLVTIAIRIGFAVLGARAGTTSGLAGASIALSMGLSIGVQNVLIYSRARRRELPIAARRSEVATRRG
ncbi:hypothetical protein [Amycolatopsis sp.]|uniref:hypothetical protein n=1 Tax=Amycolatopsis sp. TaxID=37632 RepID=UPI002CB6FE04|nr:hypothetical protein [Amycolatopsis sp.]HVV10261.1 hypothetical protein [Amycolatopsis sp.]